jgi:hypothetical protein
LFLLLFLGVAPLKLFGNNTKNNFAFICCKFLVNLQKYWNNDMSNVGVSIEIIDQSHVD